MMKMHQIDHKYRDMKVKVISVLTLICAIFLFNSSCFAESKTYFDIQPQKIQFALEAFAKKMDVSIVYNLEDLEDITTRAISGEYTSNQALEKMLEGTGLLFEQVDQKTIAIKRNSSKSSTPAHKNTTLIAVNDKPEPAAQKAAQTKTETSDDYVLKDTIVTATKTGSTNLQKTALSITAFDAQMLEDRKSFDLSDLAEFAPNTAISDGIYPLAYMRGVGNSHPAAGTESGVAIYVDGVYLERGLGAGDSLFDVERVEILRGPQGTLWGRNATGGAINVITKKPSDEFEATMGFTLGNFDKTRYDLSLSTPVTKKLKTRLTVSKSSIDGWMENSITNGTNGDIDYTAIRGKLQFDPTDSLEILLGAYYYDADLEGLPLKRTNDGPITFWLGSFPYTAPDASDKLERNPEPQWAKDTSFSSHIKSDLSNNFTFRSITSYTHREVGVVEDRDHTGTQLESLRRDSDFDTISQELQIDGSIGDFDLLAGVYYYQMRETYYEDGFYASVEFIDPQPENIDYYHYRWLNEFETDTYAVFGNIAYRPTDALKFSLGIRYSYDKKTSTFEEFWLGGSLGDPITTSGDWDSITPKFGVDYRVTEDMFLYGTIAKGFRGGIIWEVNPPGQWDVKPETVWNYETGIKADWLNKRLRTNLAVFYSDYEDMIVQTSDFGLSKMTNASESNIYGVELEVVARPFAGLTLNTTISYLDAKYGDYLYDDLNDADPSNDVYATGNQLMNAAKWQASAGASYTYDLGKPGFLTFNTNVTYRDKVYINPLEDKNMMSEARTLVNGLIRYETESGSFSVETYCKNLMDKEYQSVSYLGYGGSGSRTDRGREFGVQLTYNF